MAVFADADAIRPTHIVDVFRFPGGGTRDAGLDGAARPQARLAILPGRTHYEVLGAPELPSIVEGFLSAQLPG